MEVVAYGMFTFFPGAGIYYSPFGYSYYNPLVVNYYYVPTGAYSASRTASNAARTFGNISASSAAAAPQPIGHANPSIGSSGGFGGGRSVGAASAAPVAHSGGAMRR
jgi:hypothetical protein